MAKEDETVDCSPEGGMMEQTSSPKAKKAKKGNGAKQSVTKGDMEGTSLNAQVSESFWHKDFDFRRFMEEKVSLAKVDVDAGMKAKFSDLAVDVGISALRVLLMGDAMEKKHNALEAKYKDVVEDGEKLKHKVAGLETRFKEALKKKKTAEKVALDAKNDKEAAELERDSWKEKYGDLEKKLIAANAEVEASKGELALYFDNGFERAKVQAQHFNPDAKLDELDPFKVLVNGELVDEE